jgi:hypothetical protein
MSDTTEHTPLLHGTCVQVRLGRHRYETHAVTPGRAGAVSPNLAVAQFYPSSSDGEGITGWIVSGASSDHYSEPIDSQERALKRLHDVTRAERVLLRRYPNIYPAVPPLAHEQIRRDFPKLRRFYQGS